MIGALPFVLASFAMFYAGSLRLSEGLLIGGGAAMFFGLFGSFFADMGVIEMSQPLGLITWGIMGFVIVFIGEILMTSQNKFLRIIGGGIMGGMLLGLIGLFYSLYGYIGPQYLVAEPHIVPLSIIFTLDITVIGVIFGSIAGGIIGYFNFDLTPLITKYPLIFIAVVSLIAALTGFFMGSLMRIAISPGLLQFILIITPKGVLVLMGLWAIVGMITGIAIVGLKIHPKSDKTTLQ